MKKKTESKNKIKTRKWIIRVSIWTFILSIFISFFSDIMLKNVNLLVSFIILGIIVFIGITFDMIGIAVAAADEKPFHSMAAKKIVGAKQAIKLIRNASVVSNFCNDVIGDICGIVSGASAAIIVLEVAYSYNNVNISLFTILLSSLVASITVGGKGLGKELGINKYEVILLFCGKVIFFFKRKLKMKI